MRLFVPLALFLPLTAQAEPAAQVEVQIRGLRNANGQLLLCLTQNPAHFPDCNGDPAALKRAVPTRQAASIRIRGVSPGIYALAVVHDENGNGELNRFMAIPREGIGFSRNPVLRTGPPAFADVRFQVAGAGARQIVQIRYFL